MAVVLGYRDVRNVEPFLVARVVSLRLWAQMFWGPNENNGGANINVLSRSYEIVDASYEKRHGGFKGVTEVVVTGGKWIYFLRVLR